MIVPGASHHNDFFLMHSRTISITAFILIPMFWLIDPPHTHTRRLFWILAAAAAAAEEMASAQNQAPNVDLFDAYFRRADLDRDGKISGAEAVSFFQGSGLSKQVLAQVSLSLSLSIYLFVYVIWYWVGSDWFENFDVF